MSKDDGGPLFPTYCFEYRQNGDGVAYMFPMPASTDPAQRGPSLRDWFAGQALAGLLAGEAGKDCEDLCANDHYAAMAYGLADAMLAERAKE